MAHSENTKIIELRASTGKWLIRLAKDQPAIAHFGVDTEGTGREAHNLLREPLQLSWMQGTGRLRAWSAEPVDDGVIIHHQIDGEIGDHRDSLVDWIIRADGERLVFEISQDAWAPVYDLALSFNLTQEHCPTAVLPHAVEENTRLVPPWLFIAPDHGHLYVEVQSPMPWHATLLGQAASHTLLWTMRSGRTHEKGDVTRIRFSPIAIAMPEGIDPAAWQRIRRPWLNQFQAKSDENDPQLGVMCPDKPYEFEKQRYGFETPMMLANNVLSTPAICCTAYYSDAMLFNPEPLPGINLPLLVRRTLDDWFRCRVMGMGNVAAFLKHDLYLMTNPMMVIAAWDYLQMTKNIDWLRANIDQIQRVAAFILRRDQDQDGLTESLHSGNAWSLRDPDRSDFYLETINFGHKNAITNALAYRAYHCMVDLLTALGHTESAMVYTRAAAKLKQAYVPTFHNPATGVLAGWISQDGQIHDYVFPFVNGLACAHGLVEKPLGRDILSRIMARLHELKPQGWRWGVPINLLPVPDYDLIQPPFSVDFTGGYQTKTLPVVRDELGLPRYEDPTGERSYRGVALYNGATQTMATAWLIMGLIAMDMPDEADWLFEPMMAAAEAGELQNGLRHNSCAHDGRMGAEHHDWDGNPIGYEGYLPEGWYFLVTAMMRQRDGYRRLLPFVQR